MSDWFSSLAVLWQLAAGTLFVSIAIYLINRFFYVDESLDYQQAMDENDQYLVNEHGVDLSTDSDLIESPLGSLAEHTTLGKPVTPMATEIESLQNQLVRPDTTAHKDQLHITPPSTGNPIENEQIAAMAPNMPESTLKAMTTPAEHLQLAVDQQANAYEPAPDRLKELLQESIVDKHSETAMVDLEALNTQTDSEPNPYGNSLSLISGLGVSDILALGRMQIGNTQQLAGSTEDQITKQLSELGNGANPKIKHWIKQAQLIEDGRMDALVEYQDSL